MKKLVDSITQLHMIILGLLVVTIGFLPFFILRGNAPIFYQDQLDGEIFTYILNAKHLFDGSNTIPEVMCGLSKTALLPPSILTVLCYVFLPSLTAFLFNYYVCAILAFAGMFYLLQDLFAEKYISFVVAVTFSFLPFYSVYGLSIMGTPLLLYALLQLRKREHAIRNLLLVALYALMSSFVLIGYAVIGVLFMYSIYFIMAKKVKQQKYIFYAMGILLCIYIITNRSLFLQVFGLVKGETSHKEELVVYGMGFLEGFKSIFFENTLHAKAFQKILIAPALLLSLYGIFRYKKTSDEVKKYLIGLWSLLVAAALIGVFYGFYHWNRIVRVRNLKGGFLKYFQMDRFYWFYPLLWFVILALLCVVVKREAILLSKNKKCEKSIVFVTRVGILILLGSMALTILQNSDFKKNIYQIKNREASNAVTWNDFLAPDVLGQVKDYIEVPQDTYRVASVGIHPAASIYNGFYTIDGYSNNYSLFYKHSFRKVIAKELEKDSTMKALFDGWGNRCYVFTSELRDVLVIPKDQQRDISNLELNTQAMKDLGCKYLISSVEIKNAREAGFQLEQTFDTENSYYKIWLYSLL
ncbi:MAG TPA: DUF6044 family protein [Lachnospiraceae bacterium]|nr:DUF6044 family protein [Lachnospiraceae bacterium]